MCLTAEPDESIVSMAINIQYQTPTVGLLIARKMKEYTGEPQEDVHKNCES
jgi:hypothetical protein